jgi:hypothetical protein
MNFCRDFSGCYATKIFILLVACITSSTSLAAQSLEIDLGLWAGDYTSDYLDRLNEDVAVAVGTGEPSGGQLALGTSRATSIAAPFALRYVHNVGFADVYAGFNRTFYKINGAPESPTFAFTPGSTLFASGANKIEEAKLATREVEIGARIPVVADVVWLSPHVGQRTVSHSFSPFASYSAFGASGTTSLLGSGNLRRLVETDVSGLTYGLGGKIGISEGAQTGRLALIFDASLMPETRQSGLSTTSQSVDFLTARSGSTSATSFVYGLSLERSDFTLSAASLMLGFETQADEMVIWSFGYRRDTYTVAYPGYTTLFAFATTGAASASSVLPLGDFVSDYVTYSQKRRFVVGSAFFQLRLKIDFQGN